MIGRGFLGYLVGVYNFAFFRGNTSQNIIIMSNVYKH